PTPIPPIISPLQHPHPTTSLPTYLPTSIPHIPTHLPHPPTHPPTHLPTTPTYPPTNLPHRSTHLPTSPLFSLSSERHSIPPYHFTFPFLCNLRPSPATLFSLVKVALCGLSLAIPTQYYIQPSPSVSKPNYQIAELPKPKPGFKYNKQFQGQGKTADASVTNAPKVITTSSGTWKIVETPKPKPAINLNRNYKAGVLQNVLVSTPSKTVLDNAGKKWKVSTLSEVAAKKLRSGTKKSQEEQMVFPKHKEDNVRMVLVRKTPINKQQKTITVSAPTLPLLMTIPFGHTSTVTPKVDGPPQINRVISAQTTHTSKPSEPQRPQLVTLLTPTTQRPLAPSVFTSITQSPRTPSVLTPSAQSPRTPSVLTPITQHSQSAAVLTPTTQRQQTATRLSSPASRPRPTSAPIFQTKQTTTRLSPASRPRPTSAPLFQTKQTATRLSSPASRPQPTSAPIFQTKQTTTRLSPASRPRPTSAPLFQTKQTATRLSPASRPRPTSAPNFQTKQTATRQSPASRPRPTSAPIFQTKQTTTRLSPASRPRPTSAPIRTATQSKRTQAVRTRPQQQQQQQQAVRTRQEGGEFTCQGKDYGYYGDVTSGCKVYYVCNPIEMGNGIIRYFKYRFQCGPGLTWDDKNQACVSSTTMTCKLGNTDLNNPVCHSSTQFFLHFSYLKLSASKDGVHSLHRGTGPPLYLAPLPPASLPQILEPIWQGDLRPKENRR
ncbi:hypothetical protein Pcinc_031778, partial [Petrolisthes cinctipes]